MRSVARWRFFLSAGVPAPPREVEVRIVEHLGRWVEPKRVGTRLEVGRMAARGMGWHFRRWLTARLDEVQPEWRDYYTASWEWLRPDEERWLSEAIIGTAHARVALEDWRTTPEERDSAEQVIADARAEAQRRGVLPALTRNLARPHPETYTHCEIDADGRLHLAEKWWGSLIRDHNPT